MNSRRPCPDCGEPVEVRRSESEGNYPGAMVILGFEIKCGPEHERRCRYYKEKTS